MAFEKITDTSLANKGVTGLPDVPGLSTAEMQAKFDELSRDVIIPKLNEIVDGLNGDEVGLSSKIENPETKEKDVIQNVVNAIYQIVKENSDKRHVHENKETLDKVTAELYDSINALVSMFNGISAVDKTVTADDTKIPTSGAIVNYVTELGAGDMQKAVYDKNNTGIVDDAEKLGGVAPEEYLQKASLPDTTVAFEVAETRSNISTGEKVSTVFGKIKKFFADLTAPAFAQMITTKEDLLATKVTGYVPDAKAVADTYTELNGKLHYKEKNTIIKNNRITITQTSPSDPFICPSDGYITADSAIGITNQTVIATTSGVSIVAARSNGNFYGSDCVYVRKGMQLYILVKTGSVFFYPLE
ncbi:MAG: hypothetical protein MR442_03555 [Lachnospiraceae bacterium]|nr:hypothetical protein [Lachnospiraceae bacterium]